MGRSKTVKPSEVTAHTRSRAVARRRRLVAMERLHAQQDQKAKEDAKSGRLAARATARVKAVETALPPPPVLTRAPCARALPRADIVVPALGATPGSVWAQALVLAEDAKAAPDGFTTVDFPGAALTFASPQEAVAWAEGVMFGTSTTSPLVRYPASDRLTLLLGQIIGLVRTAERSRAAGDTQLAAESEKVLAGVRLAFSEALRGLRDALAVERKRPRARFMPHPPRQNKTQEPARVVVYAGSDIAED
jgi:hypothetical protein